MERHHCWICEPWFRTHYCTTGAWKGLSLGGKERDKERWCDLFCFLTSFFSKGLTRLRPPLIQVVDILLFSWRYWICQISSWADVDNAAGSSAGLVKKKSVVSKEYYISVLHFTFTFKDNAENVHPALAPYVIGEQSLKAEGPEGRWQCLILFLEVGNLSKSCLCSALHSGTIFELPQVNQWRDNYDKL